MSITTEEVREAYVERYGEGVGFDEWLAQQKRISTHDMPAGLFNRVTAALMDAGELFLVESLRSFYGASTRRALGLDPHDDSLPMYPVDLDRIEAHVQAMLAVGENKR